MTEEMPELTVAQPAQEDRPVKLTTPEEMEKYAELMEWNYQEINQHDRKKVRVGVWYRVVHLYPQFTGIIETEFIAKVVVERFKKAKGPNDTIIRTEVSGFTMNASEFLDKYRVADKQD